MKILFIIIFFSIFIHNKKLNQENCSSSGVISENQCSCFSGYEGSSCETKAPPSCVWNVNTQSKTDFYPIIEHNSLKYENDNLKFNILLPLVVDRLNSTLYIQELQFSSCRYPGQYSNNKLDLSKECNNKISFNIPWEKAKNCGWKVES
jgi:hypothetical protein